MKRGDCGCRNHLGKPKIKYPTQQAALHRILTNHLHYGAHSTYRCPTMEGVWHIKSEGRLR